MEVDDGKTRDLRLAGPLGELAKAFGERGHIRVVTGFCFVRADGGGPRARHRDLIARGGNERTAGLDGSADATFVSAKCAMGGPTANTASVARRARRRGLFHFNPIAAIPNRHSR